MLAQSSPNATPRVIAVFLDSPFDRSAFAQQSELPSAKMAFRSPKLLPLSSGQMSRRGKKPKGGGLLCTPPPGPCQHFIDGILLNGGVEIFHAHSNPCGTLCFVCRHRRARTETNWKKKSSLAGFKHRWAAGKGGWSYGFAKNGVHANFHASLFFRDWERLHGGWEGKVA